MNTGAKRMLKTAIWCGVVLYLLPLVIPKILFSYGIYWVARSDYFIVHLIGIPIDWYLRSASALIENVDIYLLLVAVPFTIYILIGELINIINNGKWVFIIVPLAPCIAVLSAFLFAESRTFGHEAGLGGVALLLMVVVPIAHCIVGTIAALLMWAFQKRGTAGN